MSGSCLVQLFSAAGIKTLDLGNVAFSDGRVVKVLQTGNTEDVRAEAESVANASFFGLYEGC